MIKTWSFKRSVQVLVLLFSLVSTIAGGFLIPTPLSNLNWGVLTLAGMALCVVGGVSGVVCVRPEEDDMPILNGLFFALLTGLLVWASYRMLVNSNWLISLAGFWVGLGSMLTLGVAIFHYGWVIHNLASNQSPH